MHAYNLENKSDFPSSCIQQGSQKGTHIAILARTQQYVHEHTYVVNACAPKSKKRIFTLSPRRALKKGSAEQHRRDIHIYLHIHVSLKRIGSMYRRSFKKARTLQYSTKSTVCAPIVLKKD